MACLLQAVYVSAGAPLETPKIISDGMVVQRDKEVPVWGKGQPGNTVDVRFAGQTVTTRVKPDGAWQVSLKPMPAEVQGRPMEITMSGTDPSSKPETRTIKDVQVGEVWFTGGQSNMWYPLEMMNNCAKQQADADALKNLRIYRVLTIESWDKVNFKRATQMSAAGYFFARDLRKAIPENVPLAMIDTSVGATWTESWMSREAVKKFNELPGVEKIVTDGSGYGQNQDFQPSNWYEKVQLQAVPFAIRGVLWYQGEGNAMKSEQQKKLLPAMIANWRADFNDPKLPFILVMLPPLAEIEWDPLQESWARFRETQMEVARTVPQVAVAIAPECGAAGNIHPRHKDEIGIRAALVARKMVYGEKIVASGPEYKSMEIKGNKIIVRFDNIGSGLIVKGGGELGQFRICGADHKFLPARAVIRGETVEVSNPKIAQPIAARYAFTNYPADDIEGLDRAYAEIKRQSKDKPDPKKWESEQWENGFATIDKYPINMNLYNREGLPAAPFRTDRFAAEGPK